MCSPAVFGMCVQRRPAAKLWFPWRRFHPHDVVFIPGQRMWEKCHNLNPRSVTGNIRAMLGGHLTHIKSQNIHIIKLIHINFMQQFIIFQIFLKINKTIYNPKYWLHWTKSNLWNKNLNFNENSIIVERLKHWITKNKKSLAEASKAYQQTK
jgi:hypothetical protein